MYKSYLFKYCNTTQNWNIKFYGVFERKKYHDAAWQAFQATK